MLDNNTTAASSTGPSSSSDAFTSSENGVVITNKRKRRPAGTPDPDAEVVSLSPKTLLESDKYVCEICNQGFQRDQNLQMHRRRHKVPWKLLKRESPEVKKRVFVCPEPSCLHHDPCHALGDLVGIKKHFRRKHSDNKQWICEKCSKGYAVQSDYKAHLKTCGTRGHSCDCGRVFSRVESFIEHQDSCTIRRLRPDLQAMHPDCFCHVGSSTSPSSDTNFSTVAPMPRLIMPAPSSEPNFLSSELNNSPSTNVVQQHNLELQLLPSVYNDESQVTNLKLSIGSSSHSEINEPKCSKADAGRSSHGREASSVDTARLNQSEANEQLRVAMVERAFAEEARQQAKRQLELAELEFSNAKRIRQQAQAELEKAQALKEQATRRISETISEITCHACRQRFQATTAHVQVDETSPAMSYLSSATTDAEGD